jgi:hypothetical protein
MFLELFKNKITMKHILSILILLTTTLTHQAQEASKFNGNKAFDYGEKLTYDLKYSLYLNISVAEVTMEVKKSEKDYHDREHYHFIGNGKTHRFYDAFFKVRDRYESFVDKETFEPTASINIVNEGSYHSEKYYIYDHKNDVVQNNKKRKFKTGDFSQDVLSAIYLARTFNLDSASVGDSFMINVFIDDSCYFVGMKYMGKEVIETKLGKFRCLKIQPILIVDRVFKSEEDMTLWVTDDKNKIPVRIYSGISVGAVKADLIAYEGIKNKLSSKIE